MCDIFPALKFYLSLNKNVPKEKKILNCQFCTLWNVDHPSTKFF